MSAAATIAKKNNHNSVVVQPYMQYNKGCLCYNMFSYFLLLVLLQNVVLYRASI